MLNILLGAVIGMLFGVFTFWRGRRAIKEKYLANSRKSALFTGITHFTGKKAVFFGGMLEVTGILMTSVFGLIFIGTLVYGWVASRDGMTMEERWTKWNKQPIVTMKLPRNEQQNNNGIDNSNGAATNDRDRIVQPIQPAKPLNKKEVDQPKKEPATSTANNRSDSKSSEFSSSSSKDNDPLDEDDQFFADIRETQSRLIDAALNSFDNTLKRDDSDSRGQSEGEFGSNADGVDPGIPSVAMPMFKFDKTKAIKSDLIGFKILKSETVDAPPEGAIMVGLIIGKKNGPGKIGFSSLQAVYQLGDKYVKGNEIGSGGDKKTLLIAPAGYAVSGLEAESAINVSAIRLAYMPMDEKGALKRNEREFSEWVGAPRGRAVKIDAEGKKIVSLIVASSGNFEISAVGLYAAAKTEVIEDLAASKTRTWTSANKKFTIEAEFISKTATKVKLRKADGTEIEADIKSLGVADQQFIAKQD